MIVRQLAIGFGVAIVFPLLVYYGVSTFSPPPKWPDYYRPSVAPPNASREELAAGEQKLNAATDAFAEANRVFSFRLLCVAAPLGYLAMIFGAMRPSAGLHDGLIFGGIITVTTGYGFHWSYVEDWLRFLSLLVAMAVLVLISYWRFGQDRS